MENKKDDYTGYESKYSQIYQEGEQWFSTEPTPDVRKFLESSHVTKADSI